MTTVVPRWEWRSFGDRFGRAEVVLAELSPDQTVESDELYILSATGTEVVKIRDDLVDVKQLRQVGDDGLEQWIPVLKQAFPLDADQVDLVADSLDLPRPPDAAAAGTTLDTLRGALPGTRMVDVHKRRVRYSLDGCLAELTEVTTDRARTGTIAVEAVDPDRVLAVLRDLRLASLPNVNFGRGLKVLERFGAERFAVVDIGTNSVKLHIGDRDADGSWRTVVDRADVTRLGEGIRDSGRLEPEPMGRTVSAVAAMVDEARAARVAALAAVGTAGLRIAGNGAEFVDAAEAACGVVVEVISGEDEARLAYLAATSALPAPGPRVVFDTGGGSSQFTFGEGNRVDERFSVEVGAVRFTEQFGLDGAVDEETLRAARAAIAADLGRLDGRARPDSVLAMGGAVTNLAAVMHELAEYDAEVVQGTVLTVDELDRQIELFRTRDADGRRSIVGLQPARAEVILTGACIVRTVLDKLGQDALTVSDRGLRYGVLAERFDPAP